MGFSGLTEVQCLHVQQPFIGQRFSNNTLHEDSPRSHRLNIQQQVIFLRFNNTPLSQAIMAKRCNTLQWHRNEPDGISKHRHLHCLLNCWLRLRSNITSKLHVTGFFMVTSEFTTQKGSSAGNFSIWWLHHDISVIWHKMWLRNISNSESNFIAVIKIFKLFTLQERLLIMI